ncbi:serine O-acetyltransferase [Eubacterium ruminantium]|nr:serine O-acetyltransferase [Eubacterium ruminantium]
MEEQKLKSEVKNIVDDILLDYEKNRDIDIQNVNAQPDKDAVVEILNKIIHIIFPGYYRSKLYKSYNDNYRMSALIEDVIYNLRKQIRIALMHRLDYVAERDEALKSCIGGCEDGSDGQEKNATDDEMCGLISQGIYKYEELNDKAEKLTLEFFKKIPKIREYVDTDIQATFEGDPAAYDKEEIVLSYPGLRATTINRIAHELYLLDVPLIPRIMTEYAHSRTGIDIHPGATLGKYLMIDHGTGVVVGETSIIGEHVKIYQGVTIGALSTSAGQGLRGAKRHPTIEDHVTIYSGASILGGETVIGEGAVIGGNAFITSSIKAGARVSIKNQELSIKGSGKVAASDVDEYWFYMI